MGWFKRIFGLERREPAAYEPEFEPAGAAPVFERHAARDPGAPAHPHFRTMAGPFEDARTGRFGGDASAAARAFLPAQPVSTISRFAGRQEVLREVIRAIEDQQLHVIVYGDRGIGKTSLLMVVSELAQQASYAVHYVSCGEDADFSEIFRSILSRIPLLYDATLDPSVEAVESGGTLADRLPDGKFSVPLLSEVLSSLAGAKVLIVLDEFDRASDPRFRKSIAELIKNLSDRALPVQFLIGGVASSLPGLISDAPSIRRNVVGISLPNMNGEEIRELVGIGAKRGKLTIAESAMARLVEASAGLPYLAGLLAQYGTLEAIGDGQTEVSLRHMTRAIAAARREIASRLSPTAQRVFDDPELCGQKPLILAVAAEAVTNGGMIRQPDHVAALEKDIGPAGRLFERLADDPWQGWRFVEDGASNLAWLMSV